MLDYHDVAKSLEALTLPTNEGPLSVIWVVSSALAVGRDHTGQHAIIIPGPKLHSRYELVRSFLYFDKWTTNTGANVSGNLLLLPDGHEFTMATATIVCELERQGIDICPVKDVFPCVEEFIELLLQRLLVSINTIVGLTGELLLLKRVLKREPALLTSADPTSVWRGYLHDARDFRRGAISVEVKTTTSTNRQHTIHSLDQIEARLDSDGQPKEQLYLLSIGLRPSTSGTGWSVPILVTEIVDMLQTANEPDGAIEEFLGRVAHWGPSGIRSYNHEKDQNSSFYEQRFSLSLEPKTYLVGDPNLRLIRREDLQETIVEPHGISYRAVFPESVPLNPNNPITGLNPVADLLTNPQTPK